MISGNVLGNVPEDIPDEIFQTLAESKHVRIERIVSHGHSSADDFWYDQDQHEWVLLLEGHARLLFDNGAMKELHAGDFVNIPAHVRHRVDYTDPDQPTLWLAVFYD
jgi:cupin 2 domain-containing protein